MKSRIRADAPLIGSFVSVAHPAVVEILAGAGFEFVCIDSEHGVFDPRDVEDMIRAGDAAGVPVLVRVPGVGPEIGRALDSGAAGVIVPRVESAADAVACVAAVNYPPHGTRGAGPGRASGYGRALGAYLGEANDLVACIVQIETQAGLDNLEEILAVDGVDLVFIGPGDLSVSLGVPGGTAPHEAAILRIHEAATARDIPTGIFTMTADDAHAWGAHGIGFFLVAGDLVFLASGAAATAAEVQAAVGSVREGAA